MPKVKVSRRAAADIKDIKKFSIDRWGEKTATGYLESIEQALVRLGEDPEVLKSKEGCSPHFGFCRVRKHFIVATIIGDNIYILTVKHGAMDLPSIIGELEPQLLVEAKLLDQRLRKNQ